jgi:hypothetical protein
MGYYTNFDITITGIDGTDQALKIAKEYDLHDYDLSDNGQTLTYSSEDKWYAWKEDSVNLSRNYPRILIEIYGEGEENDDIWKARIRNGVAEIVYAKIVFDDFKVVI